MSDMFCDCQSLISFPDISKWDIHKVLSMINMFGGCQSLISLPNISKWNTHNIGRHMGKCDLEIPTCDGPRNLLYHCKNFYNLLYFNYNLITIKS